MALAKPIFRPALALVSTLALALLAIACAPQVTTETDGAGGDGGSGNSGDGGAGGVADSSGTPTVPDGCLTYKGDGCKPGEVYDCGYSEITMSNLSMKCELVPGVYCTTEWNHGCDTPLVLSFDGSSVEYVADSEHGFDINGARSQVTDWPTEKTPWLAFDRDGNGSIDDGSELFGSMSPLAGGARAANGFAALRELDSNGDGRITADDRDFSRLLIWSDKDRDRRSDPSELATAAARELLSVDLTYTSEPRCDARGNCEVERASFRFRDATGGEHTGAVVDIHLPPQR